MKAVFGVYAALVLSATTMVPTLGAQAKPPADTAFFEQRTRDYTVRTHGDTVWLVGPKRTSRYVGSGDTIRIHVIPEIGETVDMEYIVRGDTAFPTNPKHAVVAAQALRSPWMVAASMKRVSRLGLPARQAPPPPAESARPK